MNRLKQTAQQTFNYSKMLSILILVLLLIGILMIFSSTYVTSTKIHDIPWYYAAKQVVWVLIGISSFLFFYNIKYDFLKSFSFFLNILVIIFLSILAFAGIMPCSSSLSFAPCINGANRWLEIPFSLPFLGTLNFQPAELAKLSLVLYLSFLLSNTVQVKKSVLIFLIFTVIYSTLIFFQPNLSTIIIIVSISTGILFLHINKYRPLIFLISLLFILLTIIAISAPYRLERIKTHFNSEQNSGRVLDQDYHVRQISIAIGSGGFTGLGLGKSMQKYNYLPEVATDSIFAIISEEGGFIFSFIVLTIYMIIIYYSYKICINCQDQSQKLISAGIMIWFGMQFFINIFSMVQIIPLTGVPLPLISSGGSSMVFMMSGLGILANIGKKV